MLLREFGACHLSDAKWKVQMTWNKRAGLSKAFQLDVVSRSKKDSRRARSNTSLTPGMEKDQSIKRNDFSVPFNPSSLPISSPIRGI